MDVDPAGHQAPRQGQRVGARPQDPGSRSHQAARSWGQLHSQDWLGPSHGDASSVGRAGPPGMEGREQGSEASQSHRDVPLPRLHQPADARPRDPAVTRSAARSLGSDESTKLRERL